MLFAIFHILFLVASINSETETADYLDPNVNPMYAEKGEFPWHVVLKKAPFTRKICGGSLISAEWVLTAAECLRYSTSVFLMFGTIYLHNTDALNMTSKNLYSHPFTNIALIKLPKPIELSEYIQPVPLPKPTFTIEKYIGKFAKMSGFGTLGDKYVLEETHNLKRAVVRILKITACNSWESKRYICANKTKDTGAVCDGDMGGAMVVKDSSGYSFQIGIIYKTPKFCDWPIALLYLQTTPLLDWINELKNGSRIGSDL